MNPEGPYVAVAALCEAVLQEKDNRASCIRFLDRMEINYPAGTPDPLPPVPVLCNVFIAIKSGAFVGSKTLTLRTVNPNGVIAKPEQNIPVVFEGGEHGIQMTFQITLVTDDEGLYWFDVLLDGERATRIPLKVVFTRMPLETVQPQAENSAKE